VNVPIIRKINMSGLFMPLAAQRTVGSFTIRNPSSTTCSLLCDDGVTELVLDRGQQFTLDGVDLSQIKAKGGLGDFLMVIGTTRTL